ncbi:hypothetical protein Cni_G28173 [Canna indica]|uniref:Uncharacterized protein n=1 Tax=Canna indica TaxID=4628 RepID=A0AAQ3L2X1_9LILI|nr:hypothetical protein Cni_G28173 [Canna indica]
MRYIWMPRLVERIRGAGGDGAMRTNTAAPAGSTPTHQAAVLHQQTIFAAESAALPNASWEHSCFYSGSVETTTQLSSLPVFAESYQEQGGSDGWMQEALPPSPSRFAYARLPDFEQGEWGESLWSVEDIWLWQQL